MGLHSYGSSITCFGIASICPVSARFRPISARFLLVSYPIWLVRQVDVSSSQESWQRSQKIPFFCPSPPAAYRGRISFNLECGTGNRACTVVPLSAAAERLSRTVNRQIDILPKSSTETVRTRTRSIHGVALDCVVTRIGIAACGFSAPASAIPACRIESK